jgi:hypothetical protein
LAQANPEKLAELTKHWNRLSDEIGEKKRTKKQGQKKKKKAAKK